MKNILITGGAGFIGSNFIEYFLKKYYDYFIINLDALTYAGNLDNLSSVLDNKRHYFIKGDIRDIDLLNEIFKQYNIEGVINFAAESHVDNSIQNPRIFIETNINGSFNLLETAKTHWKGGRNRFHHISTDEVYGTLGNSGLFIENTPYAPNSPYSASKASSDMLVRSYHHTFGLNTIITNCSNNYGPNQHMEKLIPTIIRKALQNQDIPIYGDGTNIRDWLFVQDHCVGIDLAFHSGISGESYNIGGNNELSNNFVAHKICEILDELKPDTKKSYKSQIQYVKDRAGHDKRYAIDASKIQNELGWKPIETFETGIKKTVKWYLENRSLA